MLGVDFEFDMVSSLWHVAVGTKTVRCVEMFSADGPEMTLITH